MRIAVVHSFYSSAFPSGENQVVLDQVELLASAGHEVKLFARHTDEEQGARLYKLRSALSAATIAGPDPGPELDDFAPDVVHVHNLFPNWGTAWLERHAHHLVVTQHNFRPMCAAATLFRDGHDCEDCLDKGAQEALRHRCYRDSLVATLPLAWASRDRGSHHPIVRHARRIVVLNERARAIFEQACPGRVSQVVNFVKPQQPTAEVGQEWLAVARLTPEKGVLRLLGQMPEGERLAVIGSGSDEQEIAERCQASGGSWRFLGQRNREQVLEQMRAARGLVIPSLNSEGIPTVALEALSAGTPLLLSSAMTSAPELTRDGAGEIYGPADPASLARAMTAVAEGGTARREAARRLYEREYSPEVWAQRIDEVYREVVGR
ncbi:glycosyltransferase family 4 protein [Luteococcus peritonei]|uniref:Glycosyltransferase family 4 protein n=1 Tax=Luteococcus peritonei TaxID=88874 RepID=A0ABW4RTW5_9ACTN